VANELMDLSNSLADAVERAGRNVVAINEGGQSGVSGTLWQDDLLVTAEHTIRGRQELTVELPGGKVSRGVVVGRDASTDIAAVRLKDSSPTQIEFAEATELRVGQFVLAVGRRSSQGVVASHGIISAVGGPWRTWRGGRVDQSFRLDLLPYTGFSGGSLVNGQGRVIGINTSGPRRSIMTLPASTVSRVLEQLVAKGRIARGFIGVALQPVNLPANVKQAGNGASRGLLVIMVEPGGPAERAGLMVGDIVVALEDKPLSDTGDVQAALDPERVGQTVRLRVLRGGTSRDVSLVVGEREE
jgi:S1-C subfamily serine protease